MTTLSRDLDLGVERLRRLLTDEDVRYICGLLSRLRKGRKETPSDRKRVAARHNSEIGRAKARGDLAEMVRLQWLYYPEKMRARELSKGIRK